MKLPMLWTLPRSTCRNFVPACEHHLSLFPPDTLPFTALAGPSLALQGVLPVAGRLRARLPLGIGVAVGVAVGGGVWPVGVTVGVGVGVRVGVGVAVGPVVGVAV